MLGEAPIPRIPPEGAQHQPQAVIVATAAAAAGLALSSALKLDSATTAWYCSCALDGNHRIAARMVGTPPARPPRYWLTCDWKVRLRTARQHRAAVSSSRGCARMAARMASRPPERPMRRLRASEPNAALASTVAPRSWIRVDRAWVDMAPITASVP